MGAVVGVIVSAIAAAVPAIIAAFTRSPPPHAPKAEEAQEWPRPHWLPMGVNLGMSGNSGVGKSSLMNALRCLANSDPRAAPVGVGETTMVATAYALPEYPDFRLWDLPGVGTPSFPETTQYMKDQGVRYMSVLIVVTHNRVRVEDLALIEIAQDFGTPVLVVRQKVGGCVDSEVDDHGGTPAQALNTIRTVTMDKLTGSRGQSLIAPGNVFFVDSRRPAEFDLPRLQEMIILLLQRQVAAMAM